MVDTSAYYGNWRVGGDALTGWPSAPSNGYLAGSIADVAVYPTALPAATVLSHYNGGAVGASAPIAKFTSTCSAESCTFDASTSSDTGGTLTGYSWNFGDGSPAVTGANPTHVFPTAATYSVTLTVKDNTGSTDGVSHNISANFGTGNPVAAFTSHCTALSCAFDASTSTDTGGTITSYSWNFGDGTPVVTTASPMTTHVYATSNFYAPSLTVTDSTTSVNTVSNFVFPVPAGSLQASFTSSCVGLNCSFNAAGSTDAIGTIVKYSWNWGDGSPVYSTVSPTTIHGFVSGGNYVVTLTVTDNLTSTSSVSQPVSATNGAPPPSTPVAAFSSNCTNLSCAFTDASTDTGGTITGWSWNFGDGTPVSTSQNPTHVYTAGGTYTAVLTVTDNLADTNAISHTVAPAAAPPPSTPVAAFTSNCTNLSCTFTDGSTDTGSTISGWSWNFGDGTAVSTAQNPTHVYASPGTGYTVTLTVTDNLTDTNTITHHVAPAAAPPPSTPVAAFTSLCTNLSCAFTDGSTDTGSTISGWSWNFGDGTAVSTAQNPTHVYASGGTYTVQLTVTDNLSDTNAASHSVAPTSGAVTFFASDSFNRTVSGGLGTANVGGAWTRIGGTAANLSVAPGFASFLMPSPSIQDSVYLASVSKTVSETDATFTDTNTSTGTAGVYVYIDGRRVSANNEYDARVRLTPTGTVGVELVKYPGTATATAIGSEVILPGVTFTPGTLINVRFQVSGTSPTTLKVKVWAASSPQPAAWTLTATDSTAGLQAAGAVGLTTYLSGSTTNAPTTVKFSSFSAGPLQP